MRFPTSSTRRTMAAALDGAQQQADSLKRIAQNNRDRMAAGPISVDGLVSLFDNLKGARNQFTRAFPVDDETAVARLVVYAQDQLGVDAEAAFRGLLAGIDAACAAVLAAIPVDADGHLLALVVAEDGTRAERSVSSADTADVRSALDALIDAID